jgi:membrane protease YdiL (CAAX protease family)
VICKHRLKIIHTEALGVGGGIFPLALAVMPLQFSRTETRMTDPTELVLTGGLAAALGVFVIGLMVKTVMSYRRTGMMEGWQRESGPDSPNSSNSPYEAPIEVAAGPQPPAIIPGKVAVWYYHPVDLLGVAFVFLIFAGMVGLSFGRSGEAAPISADVLAVNIGFQFVMAGIVTAFAGSRVGVVTWLGLRWEKWPWILLIAPGTVFLMWMVFGGLQISGYVEWMESLGVETVQDTVKLLQESKDPKVLGLMAFAAVVAAPICEEVVFRGYFYPILKKFTGIGPAVFCSAMLFGVAHGSLTALLPLFIFGAVLVFVYEKTGSIWAPIAVHFCFNGATVIVQMAVRYLQVPVEVVQ